MHKCKDCHRFLHAICGHDYFDENGEIVEDLAFPKVCNDCYKKGAKPGHSTPPLPPLTGPRTRRRENMKDKTSKKVTRMQTSKKKGKKSNRRSETTDIEGRDEEVVVMEEEDDDGAKENIDVDELPTDFFTEEERKLYPRGWFIPFDCHKYQSLLEKYSDLPTGISTKERNIIGRTVNIPAVYWGHDDIETEWWKAPCYEESLRMLSKEQMKGTVLIGKVFNKTKPNSYDVAFLSCSTTDYLSEVKASDIRRFLIVKSGGKKGSETSGRLKEGQINNAHHESDKEAENDEYMEEDDEYVSEEDVQEGDGSDEEENGTD